MKINRNYLNLKDSYLFSTINQKVTAYTYRPSGEENYPPWHW